jgi:hypothetical protein
MQLSVIDVLSKKDVKVFHQIARDLYKDDTHFISHIDQDIDAIFNPKINKAFEDGGAKRWIVYAGQTAVGKVAAFYRKDAQQAGIGFFDSVDNPEVANLLFDTATNWLKSKGYNRVEAPVNFGERDKYWGLLVEGFKNPSYQENYNFPYYQTLFEKYGFTRSIEQTTSEARPESIDYDKYKRFSDRLVERSDLRAEHFRIKEMGRFVQDFTSIYNEAWSAHKDFMPMTEARVSDLFAEMKPIIREDLLWFMYDGDRPVGFYLSLIDLNQLFRYLDGNMNWFGKLKFYYRYKTVKVNKIRGIIFGVIPEFQNKGVYSIMIMKMYEVMRSDRYIQSTELSWIGDFNPKMHALFDSLKAEKVKVHFTYLKVF